MTVSIHGVISHRKLMELKNCGVVEPEFFEEEVTKLFTFTARWWRRVCMI